MKTSIIAALFALALPLSVWAQEDAALQEENLSEVTVDGQFEANQKEDHLEQLKVADTEKHKLNRSIEEGKIKVDRLKSENARLADQVAQQAKIIRKLQTMEEKQAAATSKYEAQRNAMKDQSQKLNDQIVALQNKNKELAQTNEQIRADILKIREAGQQMIKQRAVLKQRLAQQLKAQRMLQAKKAQEQKRLRQIKSRS